MMGMREFSGIVSWLLQGPEWDDIQAGLDRGRRQGGLTAKALDRLRTTNIRANHCIDDLAVSLTLWRLGKLHLEASIPHDHACTRSHPHEDMGLECERKTVAARQRAKAAADIGANQYG